MEVTRLSPFCLEPGELATIYSSRTRRTAWLLVAALSLSGVIMAALDSAHSTFAGLVAAGWILTAAFAGLRWILLKRKFSTPLNRFLYEERRVEFDDEVFRWRSASGARCHLPWSNFVKAKELRNVYLLHVTSSFIVFVPKRAFANPSDENRFKGELVRRGVLRAHS